MPLDRRQKSLIAGFRLPIVTHPHQKTPANCFLHHSRSQTILKSRMHKVLLLSPHNRPMESRMVASIETNSCLRQLKKRKSRRKQTGNKKTQYIKQHTTSWRSPLANALLALAAGASGLDECRVTLVKETRTFRDQCQQRPLSTSFQGRPVWQPSVFSFSLYSPRRFFSWPSF